MSHIVLDVVKRQLVVVAQRPQNTLDHIHRSCDRVRREPTPQVIGVRGNRQLRQEIHALVGQVVRVSSPLGNEQLPIYEVVGVDMPQLPDVKERHLRIVDPHVTRRVVDLKTRLLKLLLMRGVVGFRRVAYVQVSRQWLDRQPDLEPRALQDVVLKDT